LGPVEPTLNIAYASLAFQKSPAQQTALDTLLLEQQTSGSPNFHRWLTPEQFADRFGPSPSDVASVVQWLESEGLTVNDVARGRGFVTFSGAAAHIAGAFRTELHRYRVNGEIHIANATDPSVPAALAPLILGIQGLDDFRLQPLGKINPEATAPDGTHSLAPDDLATIYSLNRLYGAGLDGTGQTLAVIGQSDFDVTQIRNFRSKYNLAPHDPKVVLYGPDPGVTGSSIETYFDLEWAGAVARNATLIYVNSQSVTFSAANAIANNLAPVISFSYGYCEQQSPSGLATFFQALAQQANAQGITWVAAAGDIGAAACDIDEPLAVKGTAVSFPASLPEITAVGGAQFNEGSGTFWNASNGPNGASALSYIPETVWNESALFGSPVASGGGASVLYQKPFWQTGAGVPADNARDLPDVVFPAAYHDSYSVCVFGNCGSGAYGTSLATQAFAGVVVLLNHYLTFNGFIPPGSGAGNINPQLYLLAGAAPNVFHDITTGTNAISCAAATPNCVQGKLGFPAAAGYDQASGLGSVDAFNLIAAWNTIAARPAVFVIPSVNPSTFTLSDSAQLTATLVAKGSGVPTGTVTFYLGAKLLGSAPVLPVAGAQTAAITVYGSQFTPGPNSVIAVYSGNANFAISSGTLSITVGVPVTTSAVIPSVNPNPVYQHTPDASGNSWNYTITLINATKVPATLTDFTVDGVSFKSQILNLFGSAAIPASGTLTASQSASGITLPYTRILGFSGTDAGGFQWTQQIPVIFLGPQFTSFITFAGNAASGQLAAAPGMLLSVFGQNVASGVPPSGQPAQSLPLPAALAGVSVTINGIPAPLFFVSPSQVNLQVPYNTPLGTSLMRVTSNGQTNLFSLGVGPVAPGIFSDPQLGLTVPFGNGSRGKTLTLFITGDGAVSPPLASGATPPAGTPVSQLPAPVLPVTMTIGGVNAPIVFRGIPSGNVGVTQLNFTVPSTAPLGVQQVVVKVGGVPSPPAYFVVNN